MAGYSNKVLESIRQRDNFGAKPAGRLSISTALKNVCDVAEQLIVDVNHGQSINDCSEAIKDIDHLMMRLTAIREAIQ